ncbi:hypothetical protein GJA_1959 [Janthinobacterium agaricidamnosum NBRC 102515 = DSM 9628]|uniref:Uncharacterized protein n=1 Tax=Janthinobacterium agaricidamnosum NBRC 102515 = DSM 9628 TaxID=1349767 RepID=W0V4S7_9BURK|nr:hypothetical protein GJA_1959 [Janthinobacterium agaricidamnosum NBRC 102515 = DSM 9628]
MVLHRCLRYTSFVPVKWHPRAISNLSDRSNTSSVTIHKETA